MTRVLAIVVLILAGLPRMGVGAAGVPLCQLQERSNSACHQVAPCATCCGGSGEGQFCHMSGGPCQCMASPLPDPAPLPKAPLHRTERDTLTAVPLTLGQVVAIIDIVPSPPGVAIAWLSWHAGRTHNEIQAFLGIWRT